MMTIKIQRTLYQQVYHHYIVLVYMTEVWTDLEEELVTPRVPKISTEVIATHH